MRVAILQFSPRLGHPEWNFDRAEYLLNEAGLGKKDSEDREADASTKKIDLLVLPELAFSGYNFASLTDIQPYLEPTALGHSAKWAANTAAKLKCLVAVGYPETTEDPQHVPAFVAEEDVPITCVNEAITSDQNITGLRKSKSNFNSLLVVNAERSVVAHYRKSHLYYTDATWAEPSPNGWQTADLHLPQPTEDLTAAATSLRTTFAICMDFNPQYFTAPWESYEMANYTLSQNADLLLASMAWLSDRDDLEPQASDLQTIAYWMQRLDPLLRQECPEEIDTLSVPSASKDTLVIIANRTGIEPGPTRACELDPVLRKAQAEARHAVQANEHITENLERFIEQAAHNEAVSGMQTGAEQTAVLPEQHPVTCKAEQEKVSPTTECQEHNVSRPGALLGPIMSLEARYAGSSTVMRLGNGKAKVFGMLGCQEEAVLFVDTENDPVTVYSLRERSEEHA